MDILKKSSKIKKMKYYVNAQDIGKEGNYFQLTITETHDESYTVKISTGEEFELIFSQIITLIEFLATYGAQEYGFNINIKAFQGMGREEINNVIREKLIDKLVKSEKNPSMLQALLDGASMTMISKSALQNKGEILLMIDETPSSSSVGGSLKAAFVASTLKATSVPLVEEFPFALTTGVEAERLSTGLGHPERIASSQLREDLRSYQQHPSDILEAIQNPNSIYEVFDKGASSSGLRPPFLRVKIVGPYEGGGFYAYTVENICNPSQRFSVFRDELLPLGSFDEADNFHKKIVEQERLLKRAAELGSSGIGRGGGGGGGGGGGEGGKGR